MLCKPLRPEASARGAGAPEDVPQVSVGPPVGEGHEQRAPPCGCQLPPSGGGTGEWHPHEWGAKLQPVLCRVSALSRWKPGGWGLVSVPLNSSGPQSRLSLGQTWLLVATLAGAWYRAELVTFLGGLGHAEGSLAEVGLSLPGWGQSVRRQAAGLAARAWCGALEGLLRWPLASREHQLGTAATSSISSVFPSLLISSVP